MIYNLLLGISTAITQTTYPLVVRLYSLFEYICTFKMLSEDFIESIWNNIYIFVAVIVLFAIAIKLISAMVNPDTLTDDKKGARGYYFRAVAAVILIFLVPIAFKASYDLQEELLTKNFLSTHVFGYKVAEGTNIGQILAWEGFSAFCLPDKASSTEIDNNYLSIRADMDNVVTIMNQLKFNGLANMVNPIMQITLIYGRRWEYHMFLCPLVGLLLVYEMVLLCMDTLFRSAKLAFLEVMTPIVLGAFVFDPSILKKWAKEFFSTYIALFLKVLAMYFIIITISQMQDEIENIKYYQGDWITTGLFKILLIISLLQLVKKIPELINKIFGLEIKSRGGIKGRLGEMAGIGGIAQKAWSSLGGYAKGLGKATLFAAAGAAAGGAKAGFNKLAEHDSKAGRLAKQLKNSYGKLKNGQVGRMASTFAAGVKSKGNGTGRAMLDTWNKNPITVSSAKAQQFAAADKVNSQLGLTSNGSATYGPNSPYNLPFKRDTKGINNDSDIMARVNQEKDYYQGKSEKADQYIEKAKQLANQAGISNETISRLMDLDNRFEKASKNNYALSQMQKGTGILKQATDNAVNNEQAHKVLSGLANSVGLDADLYKLENGKTVSKGTQEYLNGIREKLGEIDYMQYFPNEATLAATLTALAEGSALTYGTEVRSIGALEKTVETDKDQIGKLKELIISGLPDTGNQIENEKIKQEVTSIMTSMEQWHKEKAEADSKTQFIGTGYGQDIAFGSFSSSGSQAPAQVVNNNNTQVINNNNSNISNNNTNNNVNNNNTNNNVNNNTNNNSTNNNVNNDNTSISTGSGNSNSSSTIGELSSKDKNDIINAINKGTEETKNNIENATAEINSNADSQLKKNGEQLSEIQEQLDDIDNKKNNEDKDNE